MLTWSLRRVAGLPIGLGPVVVVVRPGEREAVSEAVGALHRPDGAPVQVRVVEGGSTRHASEWHALRSLAPSIEAGEVDVVAVHDAARPLATTSLWLDVVSAARTHGGAVPTHPLTGLVGLDGDPLTGQVAGVQTPQAFRAGPLLAAYRAAASDGFAGTDTAACVQHYTDLVVAAVEAPATNLKVTFPEDIGVAELLVESLAVGGAEETPGPV